MDGEHISTTNFPLPNLGPVLRKMVIDLHYGRGFFVIRGLETKETSAEDIVLRFLGISAHVADKIGVQDEYGNVFGRCAMM